MFHVPTFAATIVDVHMRSFQGLLFFGIAIFSLKWEFVQPVRVSGESAVVSLPPMKPWMLHFQASVLSALGCYFLITGEWTYWRSQRGRFSKDTFLAVTSFFLAVLVTKFAYAMRLEDPLGVYPTYSGYYPPFNEESLFLAYLVLALLGVYYAVRGEVEFWKWQTHKPISTGE